MDVEIQRLKVVIFPDGRLDTDNSARFLGLSAKTLAMMRSAGTGPRFVKRGAARSPSLSRTSPGKASGHPAGSDSLGNPPRSLSGAYQCTPRIR